MSVLLKIDYEKCTGCGLCMLACSLNKTEEFNLLKSRIVPRRVPAIGFILPKVCWQCNDALCAQECPAEAIMRQETGALVVDEELCTGCGSCVDNCPYENMFWDNQKEMPMKCDLCGGEEPQCVKYCAYGVLELIEADEAALQERDQRREEFSRWLAI